MRGRNPPETESEMIPAGVPSLETGCPAKVGFWAKNQTAAAATAAASANVSNCRFKVWWERGEQIADLGFGGMEEKLQILDLG